MKKHFSKTLIWIAMCWTVHASALNQTLTLSPIYPETSLPFRISIAQEDFVLPAGWHSGAFGRFEGKWLLLAGRTNGLHSFNNDNNNFPTSSQSTFVYVVDPINKTVAYRLLTDPGSGLTQHQVDLLSVTSPQSYQNKTTLYMTGGYGVDTATGLFSTKDVLTAIDVPGLMHWVTNPLSGETAAQYIRQISDPIFQITGGKMVQIGKNPTLLMLGQNFEGYYVPESNGKYSEQIRRFHIQDDGVNLSIKKEESRPRFPDSSLRRRDLNIIPALKKESGGLVPYWIALSGVFTESGGAWTVPVNISMTGKPTMANPRRDTTFRQGMNNYACPTLQLFSNKHGDMYSVLLGGITFEFFENGVLSSDPELPFTNEVTTVGINRRGEFTQYIMSGTYPVIISTESNSGNQFLFGAGGQFFVADDVETYVNKIIKFDQLRKRKKTKAVGYIVGGIASTLPDTFTATDSAASPYIFKVTVTP